MLLDNKKKVYPIGFGMIFAVIGAALLLSSPFTRTTNAQLSQTDSLENTRKLTTSLSTLDKHLEKESNAELESQYTEIAKQRSQSIKKLLDEDKVSEVLSVMNTDGYKKVPKSATKNVEKKVSISKGTLRLDHGDDFNDHESKEDHKHADFNYYYIENKDGKRQRLYLTKEPSEKLLNKFISAPDVAEIDGSLVASTEQLALDGIQTPEVMPLLTTRKVAAIMVKFADTASEPFTASQIKQAVFGTSGNSANTYYQEVSYNKVGLGGIIDPSGDVFGWITISNSSIDCDYYAYSEAANAALRAQGIDLSGYNNLSYFMPAISSCGWAGLGYVTTPTTINSRLWINGSIYPAVITHELGHNYGAWHASSYRCTEGGVIVSYSATSSNCYQDEYADPFDVMGAAYDMRHLSGYYKSRQGYLPASNTQSVTSTGTYNLYSQEVSTSGTQMIRIPAIVDSTGQPTAWYYIEYRQPFGNYDNFQLTNPAVNGVMVRMAGDYNGAYNTKFLDMTPGTNDFSDGTLPFGSTFNDAAHNIKITALSSANGVATVQIETKNTPTPTCTQNDPTYSISPVTQWGNPGTTLAYAISLKNNDSPDCAPQTFSLSAVLAGGLTQTLSNINPVLSPGASTIVTVNVTSASTLAAGYYSFSEYVSRGGTSTRYVMNANYNVNQVTPPTLPPVVTITNPLNSSIISSKKITIRANATSSVGISTIRVYVDNSLLASTSSSSVNYSWNPSKYTRGNHTITVTATDKQNQTTSQSITVTKL